MLAWNANAERLYGWTSGNVLGRHIGELLILPAELDAAYEIALGVEAGEIWTGDLTIVRADATPVRIHTALRPLRNERGEIVGSIGVADDVTDQRAIEDRAAELTNHLLMALAGGELGTWRRDLDTDEPDRDRPRRGSRGWRRLASRRDGARGARVLPEGSSMRVPRPQSIARVGGG